MKSGVQPWMGSGACARWGARARGEGEGGCRLRFACPPLGPSGQRTRREGGVGDGGRPVRVALLGLAAEHERCVLGLGKDDLHVGPRLPDHFAGSLEGSPRAVARDPIVEASPRKVLQDLGTRGLRVVGRICLVLKLTREEPAVGIGELPRLLHHAAATLRGGREHHLGSERAHHLPPLDREGFAHGDHAGVAPLGTDHGNGHARVARRGLHHGLTRRERARALGVVDDGDGEAVLDGGERVEKLALGVELHAGRSEAVDAHHGRATHGLEDVVVDGARRP